MVQEDYHNDNPYHNSVHAADVTQAMYCYLQEPKVSHADKTFCFFWAEVSNSVGCQQGQDLPECLSAEECFCVLLFFSLYEDS